MTNRCAMASEMTSACPIAIHRRNGSFSDRWIEYCATNRLPYVEVNCYANDIIERLRECSALLWHFGHGLGTDMLMARHVLRAAEVMGLSVFPNHFTNWHFDDKVAQMYLLEAVGAPLVPTYCFYDLPTALRWIDDTEFPKVFKLRRGSGSRNVRLVATRQEARSLARKAFSSGFRPTGTIMGSLWKVSAAQKKGNLWEFLSSSPRRLQPE